MDEKMIELLASEQIPHEKLKVFNPHIVVSRRNPERPYYSITYYDIKGEEWVDGFGSYTLENVQKWFDEELEDVDMDWVMKQYSLPTTMQPEVLQKAIDTYGKEPQVDVAIEEMSELIKALLKNRRAERSPETMDCEKTKQNIYEEIADVIIMLTQLIMIFGGREEIQKVIDEKVERLATRLAGAAREGGEDELTKAILYTFGLALHFLHADAQAAPEVKPGFDIGKREEEKEGGVNP